ncbi:MAG: MFS transporter [Rhodospirillales bacterium]|jgi:DHA1 family tetracycline resistance protein-like MFS transporter|nr:MFS transporter [Rhodospirillales bacterium]
MPTLFLIVFVDLVGFGVIIPLLPFYGEHFQASPATVGLLMATYSLAQFVSAPLLGRLSDRVGRKPVLSVSLAGAAASYLLLAFASELWMLFVARAIGGLMAGNISTAFAYVADVTTPANRAKGMGLIGAAFGLGFIFGPAIGGVLAGNDPASADFQSPALAAFALSALALILCLTVLKESLTPEVRARHGASRASRWQWLRQALADPGVRLILAMSFLATFVFAGMETTFAMWSRRQFGWGPEQNGYLFAFVGGLTAVIQGGLVGRLSRAFGERKLVGIGSALLALGMLLIAFSASLWLLLVAMAAVAAGFSMVTPALNSLLSLQVDAGAQGGMMGLARSATTMARILGPGFAGLLFDLLGKDWPFYAGAAIMVVVMLMAMRPPAAVAAAAKP